MYVCCHFSCHFRECFSRHKNANLEFKKTVLTLYFMLILGPSWLKNLYFAYLVVLRAIIKMEPYWTNHLFYTGLADDDSVNENVMKIVEAAK